jgi:lipid-binding SYLF domain-containing protein
MSVRIETLLGSAVIVLMLVACSRKEESAPPAETARPAAAEPPAESEPPPPPPEQARPAETAPAEAPTPAPAETVAPAAAPEAQAEEPEDVPEGKYAETIEIFRNAGASGGFFDNAYGYAVFPTVGKGGLGVGGARGKGQVYVGGKHVGNATLSQLSIGLQAGGQAFSEIIFFEDKRAFDQFSTGEFSFGAGVSAVAITAGASAGAGTGGGAAAGASATKNAATTAGNKYYKGMAVFTVAKGGLMYEAAIGGQKFKYEAV